MNAVGMNGNTCMSPWITPLGACKRKLGACKYLCVCECVKE